MGRNSAKKNASTRTSGRSPRGDYYIGGMRSVDIPMTDLIGLVSGPHLMQELRTMWLLDETAGSMNWCISSTMEQVPWRHTPQVDGKTDERDEEAIKYAKFADTLLDDMQDGFSAHVEDALAMIWAGFSPCEIIPKQRLGGDESRFDDGYWGIKKIPIRDPRTISGWVYDENDDFVAMRQTGAREIIPVWKLCHYRTTSELNNPQGRSLLLAARRAWKLKTKIQDAEAIGIERELVGLPIFRMPEEMWLQSLETKDGLPTEDAKRAQAAITAASDAVSKLRLNKSGGLVLFSDTWAQDGQGHPDHTPKWDFKILTTGGQRTIDTRIPIRDYDRAIARVLMMQFLHLGDRSTGSYSLSDDQSSMAYKSFMALARKIGGEWSRKALVLIWEMNGFPKKYLPLLEPGQINKQAYQALGAFMTGLGKVAGLWEGDPKARSAIFRALDIPYDREAQQGLANTAREAAENAADPQPPKGAPAPGAGNEENDDEDDR